MMDDFRYRIIEFTNGQGIEVDAKDGATWPGFIQLRSDMLGLFGDGVFDFAIGHGGITKEIKRVVKPGGALIDPATFKSEPMQGKTVAVIRYGGFGDVLQTSSIFPYLKEQGYEITVYTSPGGADVLKHDPHIDRIIIQGKDQIPNAALGGYWEWLKTRYSKFINLSESVEGAILTIADRMPFHWPKKVRHELFNRNYFELMHGIAGVPMPPKPAFYPSTLEKEAAKTFIDSLHGGPVILWILAGSSVHKTWPYMDTILARLMLKYPDCRVILAGDELCKVLEVGWENEPRIIKRSGADIRETLALINHVDLIIGPETGVLNAAGPLNVPKILFCSHSTPENCSKYWQNTINLEPVGCQCYPCHQLHYSFEYCTRDEKTGCADCQAKIDIETVWAAIQEALK